jgi:TonB family protein
MMNKRKTLLVVFKRYTLLIPLIAFCFLSAQVWGQGQQASTFRMVNEEPLIAVEGMPAFPGGEEAMMKYIAKNLRYPLSAQLQGIEGRVVVRFVVNKDGSIKDIEILRSLNPECDREAVRVIKNMLNWTPGRQNGIAVPVYYTFPITFKLGVTSPVLPPLTLIQLNNGQSLVTRNAAINKKLPLILIDSEPYQIEGLDVTASTSETILKTVFPSKSILPNIESTKVIKGQAAQQIKGVSGKNGIILITTKK